MKRALLTLTFPYTACGVLACTDAALDPVGETHAALEACGGAGGIAGDTGVAGMEALEGFGGFAGATFTPGAPYEAPAHQGNLIHVENRCGFPLWIHGIGGGGILMPDDQQIAAGDSYDYTRGDWPFAYVDAYLDGPQQNHAARAEVTFFPGSYASYRLNYHDGITLPMEIHAVGPGQDCKPVGCYATQEQIVSTCPEGLLSGQTCLSSAAYCKEPANADAPYCHLLDSTIAQCAQTVPGCAVLAEATTAQAYACNKSFGDQPQLCAAINRGTLSDPSSGDRAQFYKTAPFNIYSAWLSAMCPDVGGFAYDDANLPADSFHTCIDPDGGTQINITFCPAG